jgi:hypothetical protein
MRRTQMPTNNTTEENVKSTDKSASEDVLKAVSRIKQEGDHLDEEDYDELIELLQQTLAKIKK